MSILYLKNLSNEFKFFHIDKRAILAKDDGGQIVQIVKITTQFSHLRPATEAKVLWSGSLATTG